MFIFSLFTPFMVAFFIDQSADAECRKGVSNGENMHLKRRNLGVENDGSEIFDEYEYRVDVEQLLHKGRKSVGGIEYCRQIVEQREKYAPKILNISEKDKE